MPCKGPGLPCDDHGLVRTERDELRVQMCLKCYVSDITQVAFACTKHGFVDNLYCIIERPYGRPHWLYFIFYVEPVI